MCGSCWWCKLIKHPKLLVEHFIGFPVPQIFDQLNNITLPLITCKEAFIMQIVKSTAHACCINFPLTFHEGHTQSMVVITTT